MIHKQKIKLVVFDIDDTLYPEKSYCLSGFDAVSQFAAVEKRVDAGEFNGFLTKSFAENRSNLFNLALENFSISYDEEFIRAMVAVYREHKPDISLRPETEHVLDYLKASYALAIISDGYLPAQKLKAEALGINRWFGTVVFTEELGREYWKPSEMAFKIVADRCRAAHEECVYIADNPAKDFYAPNRLQWQSIMLEHESAVHSPVAPSAAYEPGARISSLKELEGIL